MKTYLNREEQQKMIIILTLLGEFVTFREDWEKRGNLTEENAVLLKQADDFLTKGLRGVMSQFPFSQQQRILRCMKDNAVIVRPRLTGAAMKKAIEMEAEENKAAGAWCELETAYTLADHALAGCCNPCRLSPEERKTCKAREAFLCLDIPMADENASGDECPYDNNTEV